jgi:hypothetical protein
MPYCNVKISKNQFFWNFGPFIEHGPHWINFTILTFISENNSYFRGMYKIWKKIFYLTHKKRWNVRQVMGKMKKKMNLGVLGVNPYCSNVAPRSCLNPTCLGEERTWQVETIKKEQNETTIQLENVKTQITLLDL